MQILFKSHSHYYNYTNKLKLWKLACDISYSKMDPYCVIEYGGNKYKTRTHQGAGKTPVWNHVS